MQLIGLIVLIFSAILHEIMHGVVAGRLGDPTARLAGRITLNPLPHIDPLMTILLPGVLLLTGSPIVFGAAKPVPVNPLMLKDGRKDLALVALAGPATNLALALCAALLLQTIGGINPFLEIILNWVIIYNVVLGLLNLIPIPPLDGSKLFSILLPEELALKYLSWAPFGFIILIVLLMATPFGGIFNNLIASAFRLLGVQLL